MKLIFFLWFPYILYLREGNCVRPQLTKKSRGAYPDWCNIMKPKKGTRYKACWLIIHWESQYGY